jgi:hypothetical protein
MDFVVLQELTEWQHAPFWDVQLGGSWRIRKGDELHLGRTRWQCDLLLLVIATVEEKYLDEWSRIELLLPSRR